jgi:phosphoribosylformimino-5-aminoimidazole carboxamide ribotide isomerase
LPTLAVRIIPVIDLLGGVVVRGVAGKRSAYRPIVSSLCSSSKPTAVAQALLSNFGLPELYVADLDAIAGAEPAWRIYEDLVACGVRLLIDAGVADLDRTAALAQFCPRGTSLAGIIVGLESIAAPDLLSELVSTVGSERFIFSVDLKQGRPITPVPTWQDLPPAEIAAAAVAAGARRLIVLDLADVGVSGGVGTLALCEQLRAAYPQCELIAGGGVRGPADLDAMTAAGCDAALVASALHDGRITKKDLLRP